MMRIKAQNCDRVGPSVKRWEGLGRGDTDVAGDGGGRGRKGSGHLTQEPASGHLYKGKRQVRSVFYEENFYGLTRK